MPEILRISCPIKINLETKTKNPKLLFTGPFWTEMTDDPLRSYMEICLVKKLLELEDDSPEIPLELICFGNPMIGSEQALKAILAAGNVPATITHHLYFGRQYVHLTDASSIVSLDTPINGTVPWWTKNSFDNDRKLTVCLYESKWKPETFFLTVPISK